MIIGVCLAVIGLVIIIAASMQSNMIGIARPSVTGIVIGLVLVVLGLIAVIDRVLFGGVQ